MPTEETTVVQTVTGYPLLTYLWVLGLSVWGGLVSFIQKVRSGSVRPFNIFELFGELMVAGFVGMLTFWICESSGMPELVTAACIGVTSHMGTRGLFRLEQWMARRFNLPTEADINNQQNTHTHNPSA